MSEELSARFSEILALPAEEAARHLKSLAAKHGERRVSLQAWNAAALSRAAKQASLLLSEANEMQDAKFTVEIIRDALEKAKKSASV